MKRKVFPHFWLLFTLYLGSSLFTKNALLAQDCSEANLFQKYWQYKNRFNRSFIVQDRDPSGCINDGIGFMAPASSTSSCEFAKAGFGLPATNLMISPFGWGVPGAEMNARWRTGSSFEDHDCPGGISFGDGGAEDPNHKFNWIDYGSETLTQLGWQFVTLATEYELLGRSGQVEEQQKVLEEIFLGIQAIRRLDMQTQCMIKKMYDDRKVGEALVCDDSWFTDTCHRHWDSKVKSDCDFTPDFSGYNGFFIRSDAGQNLEEYLHDPTDESWNVDAVGGDFSGLNSDPFDDCNDIDPFCWMVTTQHFISHDQLFQLFYGFTFIKKYIPESATVTLCNGDEYKPLEMVQRLSDVITSKINDHGDHITLPGSGDCCEKIVKLSSCEGGNLRLTLYGLLKTNEYIQGRDLRTTLAQQFAFEALLPNGEGLPGDDKTGLSFYLLESCTFKDLSKVSKSKRDKMVEIVKNRHKEVLLLGNDLLFPGGGESMAEKLGGKEFFENLLCEAPCEGPCHADQGFSDGWPGAGGRWPEGFECPNVPGWEGRRWEGNTGDIVENGASGAPRRVNGLDYMALFNMYMLQYGYGDFYNPSSIHQDENLVLYGGISGPGTLCTNESGLYEIEGINQGTSLENIKWTSSSNLTVSSPSSESTDVSFNNDVSPGTLNAEFMALQDIPQFYNNQQASSTVQDICEFYVTKSIELSASPLFKINKETISCSLDFYVWAEQLGEGTTNTTNFQWTVTHGTDIVTSTEPLFFFWEAFLSKYGSGYLHNYAGAYNVLLTVDNGCGQSQTISRNISLEECDDHIHGHIPKIIRLNPNPAISDVSISVYEKDIFSSNLYGEIVPMDAPEGYRCFVRKTDGGVNLIDTTIFSNGQNINVSSLPHGYYHVILQFSNDEILTKPLILIK